jgi:hypothetical protein
VTHGPQYSLTQYMRGWEGGQIDMSRSAVGGDFSAVQTSPAKSSEAEAEQQEAHWRMLFQAAGIAALTVVALIPLQGLVYILWPPPITVLDYFSVFQTTPVLGFLDLDVLLILDQILIVVVLLGLYVALRRSNPSLMLIGAAAGLLGAVLMIVSREATFSMFTLSQQHASATAQAERAALEAAGQTLLTIYNGTAFSLGYFLSGLAMLLISTVMLRSALFSRFTGAAGVAAGVTGLIPANMGTLGFVLSFLSLIPLIVWLLLAGRRLLQLSSTS